MPSTHLIRKTCPGWIHKQRQTYTKIGINILQLTAVALRPVYTGDFCRRKSMQIFVAPKLQLQNCTCKPGAIFSAICRSDIAGFSNVFETCCNFSATKIASSCRDKNRLCKRAFRKVNNRPFSKMAAENSNTLE